MSVEEHDVLAGFRRARVIIFVVEKQRRGFGRENQFHLLLTAPGFLAVDTLFPHNLQFRKPLGSYLLIIDFAPAHRKGSLWDYFAAIENPENWLLVSCHGTRQ